MTAGAKSTVRTEFHVVVAAMLHAAVDGAAAPVDIGGQVQSAVGAAAVSGRPGASRVWDGH